MVKSSGDSFHGPCPSVNIQNVNVETTEGQHGGLTPTNNSVRANLFGIGAIIIAQVPEQVEPWKEDHTCPPVRRFTRACSIIVSPNANND